MKNKVSLKFDKVDEKFENPQYSADCSGSRSDCCTRVCTRMNVASEDGSMEAWDQYLDVNAGVLQY